MRMTITVKNLDNVQRKLDSLERANYLKGVADAGSRLLKAEIAVYPPKPPESTYRRTGILGEGWRQTVMRGGKGGGWIGQVSNRVKYAPFVQDETRQAEVHRGRWHTVQSVAKEKRSEIMGFCIKAIREWLAR